MFVAACRQKKLSIRKMTIIRTARIPLIKLETNSRVVADISLGDTSGPRAANYIAQQVRPEFAFESLQVCNSWSLRYVCYKVLLATMLCV
jgi:DNA polymerase sigma